MRDNWDNLNRYRLRARGYYSVVETRTHWFILYAFYHPRDWDKGFEGEHENDLEGALAIVRKGSSRYGRLEGMVMVFHKDFFSYVPEGSPLRSGGEDIDGELRMQS